MGVNRKSLIAVAAELNEKHKAGIRPVYRMSEEDLAKAILAVTKNGTEFGRLSKRARNVVEVLVKGICKVENVTTQEIHATHIDVDGQDLCAGDPHVDEVDIRPANENQLTTRDSLNQAALDMNEVMDLDPSINVDADDTTFMKQFRKAVAIARGSDNFNEHTWDVLEALGYGPKRERETPVRLPPELQRRIKQASKKRRVKRGTGVLAKVMEYLQNLDGNQPFTREEILQYVVPLFPERDPAEMANTIRASIPSRFTRERGYEFTVVGTRRWIVSKYPTKK